MTQDATQAHTQDVTQDDQDDLDGRDDMGGPTIEQLRVAVAEILASPPAAVPLDANLFELGLDSLGVMRLVTQWRREGVRVSSRDLVADPTLLAWQDHLDLLRRAARDEDGAGIGEAASPPG
jgi:aryl carrier-like protein